MENRIPKFRLTKVGRLLALALSAWPTVKIAAQEYSWPAYSPNIAYDFNEDFGPLDPPTKILPGVSGVEGVYADDWWCFVWGADRNPEVTDSAWIPMIKRFNRDVAYMTDIMGWPRDKRAQRGYYSTVYLFGSGLSTDNASNTTPGGWMGTTGWNGEPWHNVLASYIPVKAFDPATPDGYQSGAMIHEGIHSIFANMPGGYNSAWAHESFNVWLQGTMESLRSGSFSGMGGLSAGSQIAPFIPIQCYSGWLQDGSFGGPGGQGVNKADGNGNQICTWRAILGGYQYGEAFPHALEVILGPKSIPWIWNADHSGFLLEDMALAPGGIGDAQARRVIQEYRGRQAFCDFKQWSHAFRQLLHGYWGAVVQEEWAPFDVDVDPWTMTCYVATSNSGGVLTPEARTLPGWSGANQIPLTVNPSATSASVTFNPIGANMSCQLVYRDTNGAIHYSTPVSSGVCSIPFAAGDVRNNVVIAVVCNTDYVYEGEQTRTAKFNYTLTMGAGVTGTADIHTKWWDYNPATYTIAASAGANGLINPAGAVVVDNGAVQTFTFAPAPGYVVDKVLLNGLNVGSPSSYTFNPVLSDSALEVVFRDATPPGAPSGLVATASNGVMNLDWTDNGEADFATYRVFRATSSGGDFLLLSDDVSSSQFVDPAVVDGENYFYAITAVDTEGNESVHSSEASATGVDTLAPVAPTGLTAKGTGTAAVLAWSENGEADLASYTVYRSTTSGTGYAPIVTGLAKPTYVDTTGGSGFFYVVTATDASGNESTFSAQASPVSAVLAHWDFNDPSLGAANGVRVPDSNGYFIWRVAAYDKSSNGNHLTTWDYPAAGFVWSNNSTDGDFSIKSSGDYPAAMTWSAQSGPGGTDLEDFSGQSFTVEALSTIADGGFRTVVGRDARNLATNDASASALGLGLNSAGNARFYYTDVNGKFIEVVSKTTYPSDDNVFHHFAATSDGSTVSLYVDGALVAQTENAGMAGLGKGTTSESGYHAGGWTVARGLWQGNHVDRWHGYIDSVAITGTALAPGAFLLSDLVVPGDQPPAAPVQLITTPHDGTVTLDWADNGETDLNYYTVYRATAPGGPFAPIRLGLAGSSYTDPSADNGTTYYYFVTASDDALNESPASAAASATPVDVTPPAAPTGLIGVAGDSSVSLNWNDSADADFASYTVYRASGGGGYAAIASGLTTSAYVDNSPSLGVTYSYVVTARDSSDLESPHSNSVSATASVNELLSGTAIGSPGAWGGSANTKDKAFDGNLGTYYDAVNASGDWAGLDLGSARKITLIKFAPRSGFAGRMVGGLLQASNNPAFTSGVVTLHTIGAAPAEGSLTEQAITNPGTYRYVRYLGPANGYCNVAELEFYTEGTPDTTPPAAPTGLVATAGDGTVALDWADNAEPDLTSYTVYRGSTSGGSFAIIASGLTASAFTDHSAANGTIYYYKIRAKDASSNESAFSAEASATPSDVTPPLVPSGLVATAGEGMVELSWNGNLEHDLAGYTVYRSATSTGGFTAISPLVTGQVFTDANVIPGASYFYALTARDLAGNESALSAAVAGSALVPGAGVSLSTSLPDVEDGVQNLNFSTSDATNTQLQFVGSDYLGKQYRNDDLQLGQSFTTGSNPDGYTLGSVAVRQVSWGPTDWDYDGGSITLRVFDLTGAGPGSVWYATEIASETASVSGTGSPTTGGTPTSPRWLKFTLATPVPLAANTQYGFVFGATGGLANEEFFMTIDGTAGNSYPDGFAFSVPENGEDLWDGGDGRPSDRAFVAAMTAVNALTPSQEWRLAHFDQTGDSGNAADLADPDGDGTPNLLERAFGGNPLASDPGILPQVDPTGATFSLHYQIDSTQTDLTIEVQENDDLQDDWIPAAGSDELLDETGNIRTLRFTRPTSFEPRLFLRVKVVVE